MPELFIIAGCNGAGKTTAAYTLLPNVFNTSEFINADEIARGINPNNVEAAAFSAGKIMLKKINDFIENKKSFAFETTLSGNTYFDIITRAKDSGFAITLFFVYIENVEIALERVAFRVLKGGHNIPDDVVKRRYLKGLQNLSKYLGIAHEWYILDNSKSEYSTIAKFLEGNREIIDFNKFNLIYNDGNQKK